MLAQTAMVHVQIKHSKDMIDAQFLKISLTFSTHEETTFKIGFQGGFGGQIMLCNNEH